MVSRETDDNRQRTGQEPGAAVPLMPIRGHPSGRGSQALRTAFLGRDGAGLEAPNSGICKMEPQSLSVYTWGRGVTPAQGHRRNWQHWTQLWFLLSLTGEAASTQGKGKGYSSHTRTNSLSGDGAHCQGGDLTDSRRCPMWDWVCAKEKVQGGF